MLSHGNCPALSNERGSSMISQSVPADVSCAVEVFLATALLHREQPGRADFTIQEIVNRAARENIAGETRSGVNVHASQHCVANKAPNPSRHKMLFATGKHTRRLLQPGDMIHAERIGKIFPDPDEVPERYQPVLEWAKARYEHGAPSPGNSKRSGPEDKTAPSGLESLLELWGSGKEYLDGVEADQFVSKLREGWE
jgi:hypothetical protein